ncbi:ferritin-like domain-containing protein [Longitalea arenae]|uniref:ferritin-like domain-containing protein n=1 Tax=Longitalea arenae TaxID=2812558 RepID=UPI001967BF9A|nr:ferritin-like domain-containing protein [Longitalea arenae]
MATATETGKHKNGHLPETTESKKKGGMQQGADESPSYLQRFFIDQVKDMYYAEQELLKAMPEIKNAATTEELEDAIEDHMRQTQRHVKRLEKIFHMIGQKPEGKRCEAMDGLIKECKTIIRETEENTMTRDAALIIAAQKIEHYEIASYGGLVALALTMGMERAADILDKTLAEEEMNDQLLTDIAETYINVEAEHEGAYNWDKKIWVV